MKIELWHVIMLTAIGLLIVGAATVHAEVTREQVIWWLQSNMPGVSWDDPNVVDYYYAKLNEVPTYTSQTYQCGYKEVTNVLNSTHANISVYDCSADNRSNELKYYKIRDVAVWMANQVPTYANKTVAPAPANVTANATMTLEQRVRILEEKLTRLCAGGIQAAC